MRRRGRRVRCAPTEPRDRRGGFECPPGRMLDQPGPSPSDDGPRRGTGRHQRPGHLRAGASAKDRVTLSMCRTVFPLRRCCFPEPPLRSRSATAGSGVRWGLGCLRVDLAVGFLKVDPTVLMPLAAVLQAQRRAQARPFGLDQGADPPAVVTLPLRPMLLAMVPAVGARVDRPLTAHLPSGSSPSGSRSSVSQPGRTIARSPESAIATLGRALRGGTGGQRTTPAPFEAEGAGVVLYPPSMRRCTCTASGH